MIQLGKSGKEGSNASSIPENNIKIAKLKTGGSSTLTKDELEILHLAMQIDTTRIFIEADLVRRSFKAEPYEAESRIIAP